MASTSEVGHAKNLANLQKLIDLVTQLGPSYNPTNSQITLASLNTLLTNCTTDYNNWVTKYAFWKTTTNAREVAFKPISQLCTQVLDNVSALNVTKQTVDDIASVVHKIHGYSKKIVVPDPQPGDGGTGTGGSTSGTNTGNSTEKQSGGNTIPVIPIISISTSQKSYDNLIANLDKLIHLLQGITSYNPNEANIKVTALQTTLANLKSLNINAVTATNSLALARNQRNVSFYTDGTGLYDISKKVKKYMRQILGSTNAIYHQATALRFVRIVPRKKKKKAA